MMYRTICVDCVHFRADEEDGLSMPPTCRAFPSGIPDEILRQGFDHREPFEGDGGIRFTPEGEVDPDKIEAVVNPKTDRNPANW